MKSFPRTGVKATPTGIHAVRPLNVFTATVTGPGMSELSDLTAVKARAAIPRVDPKITVEPAAAVSILVNTCCCDDSVIALAVRSKLAAASASVPLTARLPLSHKAVINLLSASPMAPPF